jgi:hypothetical protein
MKDRTKEQFKDFEGKKVILTTRSGLTYNTSNLQIINKTILFNDKFGMRVMISTDEVLKIEEVNNVRF